MKPARQFMEKRGQIAVRDDSFGNGEEGSVAVAGVRYLIV
jgi:hypothetical protein